MKTAELVKPESIKSVSNTLPLTSLVSMSNYHQQDISLRNMGMEDNFDKNLKSRYRLKVSIKCLGFVIHSRRAIRLKSNRKKISDYKLKRGKGANRSYGYF